MNTLQRRLQPNIFDLNDIERFFNEKTHNIHMDYEINVDVYQHMGSVHLVGRGVMITIDNFSKDPLSILNEKGELELSDSNINAQCHTLVNQEGLTEENRISTDQTVTVHWMDNGNTILETDSTTVPNKFPFFLIHESGQVYQVFQIENVDNDPVLDIGYTDDSVIVRNISTGCSLPKKSKTVKTWIESGPFEHGIQVDI